MPEVIRRTPETEKAQEYSIPDLIAELAEKVVKDTKKGFKQDKKFDDAELIDLALSGVGGAIAIKGPKAVSRALRTIIKKELKARGKPQDDWVSDVLRGSWFHGRGTYPKSGESFGVSRQRQGNLGEPAGISLTAQPELFRRNFAEVDPKYAKAIRKLNDEFDKIDVKRVRAIKNDPEFNPLQENLAGLRQLRDKLSDVEGTVFNPAVEKLDGRINTLNWELVKLQDKYKAKFKPEFSKINKSIRWVQKQQEQKPFARVLPRFNAPPEEVSLPVWKAARTFKAQEVMKDAYREALKKQPSLFKLEPEDLSEQSRSMFKRVADFYGSAQLVDVQHVDNLLAQSGGAVKGDLIELRRWLVEYGAVSRKLKANWRSNIDTKKFNQDISDILTGKGYKSLLYSPHRYNEWEMRMLDPKNVIKIDMRKLDDPGLTRLFGKGHTISAGPRRKIVTKWEDRTEGFPHSLRDIYADINLEKIK